VNGTVVIGIDGDKPKKVRGEIRGCSIVGAVMSCQSASSKMSFVILMDLLMTLSTANGRDPLHFHKNQLNLPFDR
jgi:hypothetical protein